MGVHMHACAHTPYGQTGYPLFCPFIVLIHFAHKPRYHCMGLQPQYPPILAQESFSISGRQPSSFLSLFVLEEYTWVKILQRTN